MMCRYDNYDNYDDQKSVQIQCIGIAVRNLSYLIVHSAICT